MCSAIHDIWKKQKKMEVCNVRFLNPEFVQCKPWHLNWRVLQSKIFKNLRNLTIWAVQIIKKELGFWIVRFLKTCENFQFLQCKSWHLKNQKNWGFFQYKIFKSWICAVQIITFENWEVLQSKTCEILQFLLCKSWHLKKLKFGGFEMQNY